jgi:hypothetical protein
MLGQDFLHQQLGLRFGIVLPPLRMQAGEVVGEEHVRPPPVTITADVPAVRLKAVLTDDAACCRDDLV